MKFKVTFVDEIDADSEEDAYKILADYLNECGQYQDVTAFEFKEIKKKKNKKKKSKRS